MVSGMVVHSGTQQFLDLVQAGVKKVRFMWRFQWATADLHVTILWPAASDMDASTNVQVTTSMNEMQAASLDCFQVACVPTSADLKMKTQHCCHDWLQWSAALTLNVLLPAPRGAMGRCSCMRRVRA